MGTSIAPLGIGAPPEIWLLTLGGRRCQARWPSSRGTTSLAWNDIDDLKLSLRQANWRREIEMLRAIGCVVLAVIVIALLIVFGLLDAIF